LGIAQVNLLTELPDKQHKTFDKMNKTKISLSVIVPAFNEEESLARATESIISNIHGLLTDYEIIIVDDGSTDTTNMVAQELAQKNNKIKVVKNQKNAGLGFSFRQGILSSTKEYVTQFHGDNDANAIFIQHMLEKIGEADIITIYPTNTTLRTFSRQIYSKCFIVIMNALFGLKLKYYNGAFLCKVKQLSPLHLTSKGFAVYAEAKVRLYKRGCTLKQIPFQNITRAHGKSKAVNVNNFIYTIQTIFSLLYDIYIVGKP
jgi:glycosyltransferase involved in cell wall biosynthesis